MDTPDLSRRPAHVTPPGFDESCTAFLDDLMPTTPTTEPAPTCCEIGVRVRYAECDPMGYLHHAKYFEFFEMGRTELLRRAGIRYRDLEADGVLFVVFEVQAKYRRPAHYDDQLTIRTSIAQVRRASIQHRYEVFRDGMLLCEASSTVASVGRSGSPIALPDMLFRRLESA